MRKSREGRRSFFFILTRKRQIGSVLCCAPELLCVNTGSQSHRHRVAGYIVLFYLILFSPQPPILRLTCPRCGLHTWPEGMLITLPFHHFFPFFSSFVVKRPAPGSPLAQPLPFPPGPSILPGLNIYLLTIPYSLFIFLSLSLSRLFILSLMYKKREEKERDTLPSLGNREWKDEMESNDDLTSRSQKMASGCVG